MFIFIEEFSFDFDFIINGLKPLAGKYKIKFFVKFLNPKCKKFLDCGQSFAKNNLETHSGNRRKRIIGGMEAIPHSWPSIALLNGIRNGRRYRCGGTLIDESTILTAAQ